MLKVVCAIIINENKFLVTQLSDGCRRSLEWEFPGGKVEFGEDVEAAIIREIKEELMVEIEICEKLTPIIHSDGEKEFTLIPFLCRIVSGVIALTEHKAMEWIESAQLAGINLSEADKTMIQHHENKKMLKEYTGKNMYNAS